MSICCLLMCGFASGIAVGLMSLDELSLEIKLKNGS